MAQFILLSKDWLDRIRHRWSRLFAFALTRQLNFGFLSYYAPVIGHDGCDGVYGVTELVIEIAVLEPDSSTAVEIAAAHF